MEKLPCRLRDNRKKYDKSSEVEETVDDRNGIWSHTDAIFMLGRTCCLSQGGYYTLVKKTLRPYFPDRAPEKHEGAKKCFRIQYSCVLLAACGNPFDTE
jgi:hypothetical protein